MCVIMFINFSNPKMPTNVFGKSNSSEKKVDTSSFVQKIYLRTNYIEAKLEGDIDVKKQ